MKYIKRTSDGTWELSAYEAYLSQHRASLAAVVTGDILRIDRLLLGPESLHDSRVESAALSSVPSERGEAIDRFELCLLGPYFDRHFVLRYRDVAFLSMDAPPANVDLLVHELRLDGDLVIHEFLFDHEKRIEVHASHASFEERIHGGPASSG